MAYFIFSLAGLALQSYRLAERSAAAQKDITRLEAESKDLQAEVARLKTDQAVESLVRAQLGYTKDGETAVVVDFGPGGPPKTVPTPTPTPVPNWSRWRDALFGP